MHTKDFNLTLYEAFQQPYDAIFAYAGEKNGIETRIVIIGQVVHLWHTTWITHESGEKRASDPLIEHIPFSSPAEADIIVSAFPKAKKFTVIKKGINL